jgi:D-tyrosyl-tRNA(Tyr) deacylase
MRAVVQRVSEARVRVGDRVTGEIARGLLVLLAIARGDGAEDVRYVAGKIRDARIFEGEGGKPMDRSVVETGGAVLVVSQFTLYGDMRKGEAPVVRCRRRARRCTFALRRSRERIAGSSLAGGHRRVPGHDARRVGERWSGDHPDR